MPINSNLKSSNLTKYLTFKKSQKIKLSESPLTCACTNSIATICDMIGSIWLISDFHKILKCDKFTNSTIFDCTFNSKAFIFVTGDGIVSVLDPNRNKCRLIEFNHPIRSVTKKDENVIFVGFFGGDIIQIDLRERKFTNSNFTNPNLNNHEFNISYFSNYYHTKDKKFNNDQKFNNDKKYNNDPDNYNYNKNRFVDVNKFSNNSPIKNSRSVTALLQHPYHQHILYSAHSPNGIIKQWDLRYTQRFLIKNKDPLFVYKSKSTLGSQFPIISMFYNDDLYCLSDKISIFNDSLIQIKSFDSIGYRKFGKIVQNENYLLFGSSNYLQLIELDNLYFKKIKIDGANGLFQLNRSIFLYTNDGYLLSGSLEIEDERYDEFVSDVFCDMKKSRYRL
ncbi:hypothetical protein DMUE_5260 [Dictyocoela muelleri]|nr:hypothetical protein DMUE_5260 [Dictyocoela muelleri]